MGSAGLKKDARALGELTFWVPGGNGLRPACVGHACLAEFHDCPIMTINPSPQTRIIIAN